ncbi:MAG TPA: hypothetical protein VNS60_12385 [Solirubrobacterales bacterium]|nr:hypothetical protein [Solirubrobacterales bacterium]
MSSTRGLRKSAALAVVALAATAALLLVLLGSKNDQVVALTAAQSKTVRAGGCSAVVSSLSAAEASTASAPSGAVICLTNGSYDELHLDADKTGSGVTVRAENPGKATIAAADLNGSGLLLSHFIIAGEITIEPGSRKISVLDNRISGGYFGLNAGPTTSTSISDTTVRGNLFAGPFGEDAIRLNRYHDSGDADPYGILIEGNEITGVRENGNHSDCLQSVWGGDGLYFRRNYLHDNRCQGFFVKDQPAPVENVILSNNLMLRNAASCDPPGLDCGPPAVVQLYGPIRRLRLDHNTIWTASNRSPVVWGEGPFESTAVADNVLYRAWSEWNGGFPGFADTGNVVCQWEGTLPRLSPSSTRSCTPRFQSPKEDDYRLRNGNAGITWSPTEQRYGPSAR